MPTQVGGKFCQVVWHQIFVKATACSTKRIVLQRFRYVLATYSQLHDKVGLVRSAQNNNEGVPYAQLMRNITEILKHPPTGVVIGIDRIANYDVNNPGSRTPCIYSFHSIGDGMNDIFASFYQALCYRRAILLLQCIQFGKHLCGYISNVNRNNVVLDF